ncbi:MAG: phosphate ABC transporter substrate-binding protein [Pseudomonadota bacterium]
MMRRFFSISLMLWFILVVMPTGNATFQLRAEPDDVSVGDPEAVVVIVAADSPVRELTREQVEAIFMGRTLTFPDGRRAAPVGLPEGAEARGRFFSRILGRSAAQVRAHWARLMFTGRGRPPATLSGVAAVLERVAGDPAAISYVQRRDLNESVRVVFE